MHLITKAPRADKVRSELSEENTIKQSINTVTTHCNGGNLFGSIHPRKWLQKRALEAPENTKLQFYHPLQSWTHKCKL